jgi:hypothetical protein
VQHDVHRAQKDAHRRPLGPGLHPDEEIRHRNLQEPRQRTLTADDGGGGLQGARVNGSFSHGFGRFAL